MPNVYIANNGGHDYTEAEAFGKLVFCTTGSINKTDLAQMFRELTDALRDANPDDYLLITSLTSLCSVATGILADRFGTVNFLIYDGGRYLTKTVVFESFYGGD
jgi:hypothetical protein